MVPNNFESGIYHIQKEQAGYHAESAIKEGYVRESVCHSQSMSCHWLGVLMLRKQLCSRDASYSEGTRSLSCRICYSSKIFMQ